MRPAFAFFACAFGLSASAATPAAGFSSVMLGSLMSESIIQTVNLGPSPKLSACLPTPRHVTRDQTAGNRDPLDVQLSDRFELVRGPLSENRYRKLTCAF